MFGLGTRLAVFGTVAVVAMGWYYTDRALNYVEVQARIDEVTRECHLERTKHYLVAKKREWTNDTDCDTARDELASDPRMADMGLKVNTKVTVRYTSPADGQIHTSSYKFSGSDTESKALTEGGVVNILASKTSPEKIQRD